MSASRSRTLVFLGLAALGFACGPAGGRLPGAEVPPRWALELVLRVSGDYRVFESAGPTVGHFAFTIRWRGTIERDDVDWRLIHKSCDVLDWKADETPAPQSPGAVLGSEDFVDKPAFHFRYFLQDSGRIEVDFVTEGFAIPLNPSGQKFPLILPSSARTAPAAAEQNYDPFVTRGSNRIVLAPGDLDTGRLERTFDWSWSHNLSRLEPKTTVFCRQTHDAHLTLKMEPLR